MTPRHLRACRAGNSGWAVAGAKARTDEARLWGEVGHGMTGMPGNLVRVRGRGVPQAVKSSGVARGQVGTPQRGLVPV